MSESQRPRSKRSTRSSDANERSNDRLDTSGPPYIPLPLTSLVGRERDVSAVTTLLQSGQARLLTLTGPGGVGKTRLALQVAANAHGSFADGTYFISLVPISDPDLVLSTIAQTLGVSEAPGQPLLHRLCTALRDKHLLLILDNFEQVVSAGPRVLDLLQCAPRLHALVTSRTVLHVYGEQEYQVSPLSLPDPDAPQESSLEQLTRYEAIHLFIERARAVKPAFIVTTDNAPAVTEICARLDGLPLAIELAAARIKLLSPQALLDRLAHALPLLTRGATTLPYRHQTLRDAIAWSYDLLPEDEKELFRALSVFVGGCTLDAAEAVCSSHSSSVLNPQSSVLNSLAALVDKSLIRQDEQEDGEPRFSMLETIHEFAHERLEEADSINGSEAKDIRRLHAVYYLALAEEAGPHLTGPEQLAWANRIETEHDNLRAALSTTLLGTPKSAAPSIRHPIPDTRHPSLAWVGLRLAGTIWQFWAMRGHLAEGRRWLQLALDAAEKLLKSGPETLRRAEIEVEDLAGAQLKVLNGMGVLARMAGDFPAAREALEGGLKIAREYGDQQAVAATLGNLGAMATLRGDYADARRFLGECLAIRRKLGLELEASYSLTQLGNVALLEGDYAEARRLLEEGLAIKRRAGDKQGIGHSLHSMATIALREGDYAEARRLYEETLAIARELGNRPGMAYSLRDLGNVMCELGDYAEAHKSFLESLILFQELEELLPIIECLIGIARVTARTGQPGSATRLLGASHAMLETTEGQLDPPDRAAFERDLAELRAQLGEESFTAAWEEGKALTLEKAVAFALEALPTESAPTSLVAESHSHTRGVSEPGSELSASPVQALTPREIEVLQLVAAGLTNPGIAAHLHLSMGTVQTHMSSIFSKINVNTRAAAVRYAFEHSLV